MEEALTAVNITVSPKSSTEPSIKDFQDFVADMQKTITSLRKQVWTHDSLGALYTLSVSINLVKIQSQIFVNELTFVGKLNR